MYEKEDNFKLGLESYFTGSQYLYNGIKHLHSGKWVLWRKKRLIKFLSL
jgi:hypothetical protein